MSLVAALDAISKLTEGELAVLGQVLTTIKSNTTEALANAKLAVLWSQYSLKRKKNPNPTNLLDPYTGLAIVEPEYQSVEDYPIIFGNASDSEIPARSITFAFGAKAFLAYENDAKGAPYFDLNYVGNTAHNLAELEVVNYRTLINTIQENRSSLNETYLSKVSDTTSTGSKHIFGSVRFRGGTEPVYYGAEKASREIVTYEDLQINKEPKILYAANSGVWNSGLTTLIELILVAPGGSGSPSDDPAYCGGGGGGIIHAKMFIKANTDYTINIGAETAVGSDGGDSTFSGTIGISGTSQAIALIAGGGKAGTTANLNNGCVAGGSISGLPTVDAGALIGFFDLGSKAGSPSSTQSTSADLPTTGCGGNSFGAGGTHDPIVLPGIGGGGMFDYSELTGYIGGKGICIIIPLN